MIGEAEKWGQKHGYGHRIGLETSDEDTGRLQLRKEQMLLLDLQRPVIKDHKTDKESSYQILEWDYAYCL